MTAMKKAALICMVSAIVSLMLSGCGLPLNKSRYAYSPSATVLSGGTSLPVTVVVEDLADVRGRENSAYQSLLFFPLVPYANSHYDRPELYPQFSAKGFNAGEDLSRALMLEIQQNHLFDRVVKVSKNMSIPADLKLTGRVLEAGVDTKITLYGISLLGVVPLMAGLPEGKLYNRLDVRYELRRTRDDAVVWEYRVKGNWNRLIGFYYNYWPDEPYTGINEMLREGLHDAVKTLMEATQQKPLAYWK